MLQTAEYKFSLSTRLWFADRNDNSTKAKTAEALTSPKGPALALPSLADTTKRLFD
jgi:hypothetical protein